jgi:hypothetical protein
VKERHFWNGMLCIDARGPKPRFEVHGDTPDCEMARGVAALLGWLLS